MNKVDILIEQTSYLLEKQKETLAFFKGVCASVNKTIQADQEKAERAHATAELESFSHVRELLDEQEEEATEQLENDINFLEEQLGALKQVQNEKNPESAEEIAGLMLDEKSELPDTKQFKADVAAEAEEVQQSFKEIMDDISGVLKEDGIKELELLLEAQATAQEEEEGEEEEDEEGCCGCCSDEEDEECDEEECGSSCGRSCGGCNIFKGLDVEVEEEEKPAPKSKK